MCGYRIRTAATFALLPVLLLLAAPVSADRLVTLDGRVLEVQRARRAPGGYRLLFEHGEVFCTDAQLAEVEIEGDMSGYEPADQKERDFLARGYVRYRGRWVSKVYYADLIGEEARERTQRIAELTSRAQFERGYTRETEHFILQSNTSPELVSHYAELLESFVSSMAQRIELGTALQNQERKLKVNIHRSQADFLAYHGERDSIDSDTFGYFSPGDGARQGPSLSFFHQYEDPSQSDWIALHECTHFLTYSMEPGFEPPVWLNEAIADYYGSASCERSRRGKLVIEPGQLQLDRMLTVQEALQRGSALGLEHLFQLTPEEFGAFEYAHAWSFVYFLEQQPDRRRRFEKFFSSLYTLDGVPFEETPRDGTPSAAGGRGPTVKRVSLPDVQALLVKKLRIDDLAALEREWHEFVRGLEIDGAAARFRRGYNLVRNRTVLGLPEQRDQAQADLIAAIEGGVRDPRVWSALGWIRIHEGRRTQAAAEFRRAVQADPLHAGFRFDLGYALSGFAGPGGFAEGKLAELEEARMQFGLCTELEPDEERYREIYAAFVEQLE